MTRYLCVVVVYLAFALLLRRTDGFMRHITSCFTMQYEVTDRPASARRGPAFSKGSRDEHLGDKRFLPGELAKCAPTDRSYTTTQ
jgi:hypothetical protein